jgi:RNA polymerase primary sigma factor
LKEIGEIDLLDGDREFWLAVRIEAYRRADALSRSHPLARRADFVPRGLYNAMYEELLTNWKRLVEDTKRMDYPCPDFELMLAEAQMLRDTWTSEQPSYLRHYMDNGRWGKDRFWDAVARHAIAAFISLYVLPENTAMQLGKFFETNRKLPSERTFLSKLPEREELQDELDEMRYRASDARADHHRSN